MTEATQTRLSRAKHMEQVLASMRRELGDLTQYSSAELLDLLAYFQEFCVTLEDEAQSPDRHR